MCLCYHLMCTICYLFFRAKKLLWPSIPNPGNSNAVQKIEIGHELVCVHIGTQFYHFFQINPIKLLFSSSSNVNSNVSFVKLNAGLFVFLQCKTFIHYYIHKICVLKGSFTICHRSTIGFPKNLLTQWFLKQFISQYFIV